MIAWVRRLLGSDPRALRAEEQHTLRVAALDKANAELEELNQRLDQFGSASRREGLALARTIEELAVASLRPEAFVEAPNGTSHETE